MLKRLIPLAAILALMLIVPWESVPQAAIGVVQNCHANSGGGKAASVSCTMTPAAGNMIVLVGFANGGANVGTTNANGCSDSKSQTYTFTNISGQASSYAAKVCYTPNVATGSTTFTWTNQSVNDWSAVLAIELSGMPKSGTIIDKTQANAVYPGSNPTTGTTAATTNANAIALAFLDQSTQTAYTCDAAYTLLAAVNNYNVDVSWGSCYKILSTTGTQVSTWTNGSTNVFYSANINVFDAAAGNTAGLLPWLIGFRIR